MESIISGVITDMIDEMYELRDPTAENYSNTAIMSSENLIQPSDYNFSMMNPAVRYGSDELIAATKSATVTVKAKISSHPHYSRLLHAYLQFFKVGAPPKMGSILEEIERENHMRTQQVGESSCIGADPELDQFMETYCEILDKYKSDISRPFEEATNFLSNVQTELRNLCDLDTIRNSSQDQGSLEEDGAMSSDEECSGGEVDILEEQQPKDEERDLIKDQLLRRFGSHISSLKLEFSTKKKKTKLPKKARLILLEWWNAHYKWPYPTDADKIALAEMTGLSECQINNWFINQRKRHWKPFIRGHAIWSHGH